MSSTRQADTSQGLGSQVEPASPAPASHSSDANQSAGSAALKRISGSTGAPSISQVLAGEAELDVGQQGPAVRYLAQLLGEPTSHVFNEHILHRVQSYQRSVGLSATGVVDSHTLHALKTGTTSKSGAAQMAALAAYAATQAGGGSPGGNCYKAVAGYIEHCGFGAITNIDRDIPGDQSYAIDFSRNVERRSPAKVGLRRLELSTPYDAPEGAIIVVKAGTPGTANPVAGDITVKGPGDHFYNDGEMDYGGRDAWTKPHGGGIAGIYIPL